jgi:hypothetical protein
MPQEFINQGEFTQLGVKLVASEELGLIPSLAYIEDLFGVDGQVTILGNDGSQRVLLMPEITSPTPHTEFLGYIDLEDLVEGTIYRPAGRIVDRFSNVADLLDFDLQFYILAAPQPPQPPSAAPVRRRYFVYAPARAMNQRGLRRYYEC